MESSRNEREALERLARGDQRTIERKEKGGEGDEEDGEKEEQGTGAGGEVHASLAARGRTRKSVNSADKE